jgi:hypothetical protein
VVITPITTPGISRHDLQLQPTAEGDHVVIATVVADKTNTPWPFSTAVVSQTLKWSPNAPGATRGYYGSVVWAPKRNRIAFGFRPEGLPREAEIHVVDPDGHDMRHLIISSDISSHGLNWSPDETKLLYTKWVGGMDDWFALPTLIEPTNSLSGKFTT